MKEIGIVRNVDKLGRIVIPKELRKVLGLEIGTPVEISVAGNGVFLKRYETTCTFCGTSENLTQHHDKWICNFCKDEIANK